MTEVQLGLDLGRREDVVDFVVVSRDGQRILDVIPAHPGQEAFRDDGAHSWNVATKFAHLAWDRDDRRRSSRETPSDGVSDTPEGTDAEAGPPRI